MNERDQSTMGPSARLRVDEFEPASLEACHRGPDVVGRERKMMQALAAPLDEARDDPVRAQRLEELDLDTACAEERRSHAFRRDVFDGCGFEAQRAVRDDAVLETLDRDPDVMGRPDHTSCRSRYVPKAARNTSLISPTVALAFTAERISGTRFALV